MTTAWDVARFTSSITVLGWLLSPIIGLLLPKILSYLGFDASENLVELDILIIPELKKTLQAAEEQMLRHAEEAGSGLDKMVAKLRHARDEVEDILDLVRIEKAGGDGSSWPQRLYGTAVETCNKSWLWIARIIRRSGSARLLQSFLCRFQRRSDEPARVATTSTAPSDEPVHLVPIPAASDEPVHLVPIPAASARPVPVSCCFSSLNFVKNCCRSIFHWLVDAIKAACFYRNWSYQVVGITSYQENATALDSVLSPFSRWNLNKRIEKVKSTVSKVKKSPYLDSADKTAPKDIGNQNRSKIRSSSTQREVFGRDASRDYIMKMLHDDAWNSNSSRRYSVIGIHGVAGSGKTTLAQYVLDHASTMVNSDNGKHFDTVMCIHLSKTFRVEDIFHEMLNDITKDPHSDIKNCEDLEEKLKKSLTGKRFFLILDDIWVKDNNYLELKELLSPLNVGMKGSKILATARREDAVRALGVDESIAIPDLEEEIYFEMFWHNAVGVQSIDDRQFEPVGRKISNKLCRSPIAAVTVGGLLRSNPNITFWKATAELDVLKTTRGALWWSYLQLDVASRRCLEYCNMFPRRFKLKRRKLVGQWMAQGFIETSGATEYMQDVADLYIQELVSCSFLQPDGFGNPDYFTIHDLVHDLLDKVTGNYFLRIENASRQKGEGWKRDVPRDVRHLFVQNYDEELITEKILELENLRTLIIYTVGRDTLIEEEVMESICKRLPKLRILDIALNQGYTGKVWVEEFMSQLKNLHYLALRTHGGFKTTCWTFDWWTGDI